MSRQFFNPSTNAWDTLETSTDPVSEKPAIALLSGDGAIPQHTDATYAVTKGSAAALTLAAPTATTDDGIIIEVFSTTAFAHAITATGLLNTGAAAVNVATMAAHAGASVRLIAYQGAWYVLNSTAITFS